MDRPDPLGIAPFYFEEFFRDGLHLACPRCSSHVIARFGSEVSHTPYWERRMSLFCRGCGYDRSGERAYAYWRDGVSFRFQMLSPWMNIMRRDDAGGSTSGAKAELWARAHCLGHELVAVNPWHLKAMRSYIAPLVRADCPLHHAGGQDWRQRLPPWVTDEDNRDIIVGTIGRLGRFFDETSAPGPRRIAG
ncbi:MAG TPA: hypothetical protein VLA52_15605 [Thermohalobaculum sp.]|nr:hypothetical protein [Thermohalobaculum sp.]